MEQVEREPEPEPEEKAAFARLIEESLRNSTRQLDHTRTLAQLGSARLGSARTHMASSMLRNCSAGAIIRPLVVVAVFLLLF